LEVSLGLTEGEDKRGHNNLEEKKQREDKTEKKSQIFQQQVEQ
jgi:hypothetical protein